MTKGAWLTVAAGLLILTYLLLQSRGPDQARQMRLQSALQAMQLHDAELNRDVLLVRAGLLEHYDSLPRLGRQLIGDLSILRSETARLDERMPRTPAADEVASLADAVAHKLTLIEYLKSDNAVLRNSITYFGESMRARGARYRPVRQLMAPTEMEAAALSHVVVRFIASPGPRVMHDADTVLARVEILSRQQHDLAPLVAHGRLVIDVLPRLDALLAEIAESPTGARAEALQRAILESASRTESRAQRFRVVMYLLALLMLGYVVYQVARLRARTRELRRQEMQLIQANKMTSLGMLVSGVAHEVNNPNQLVLMNASVLASAWDDIVRVLDVYWRQGQTFSLAGLPYGEMRETVPPLIRQIRDGARRIDRIIADLKDFARPGPRVRTRVALNDVVHRAVRLLTHVIQQHTDHFELALAPDPLALHGDPQQVEQVVVNLVINALEALPDRTRGVTLTTWLHAETNTVSLEVRDEGVGIAEEHVSRLGEPFFTTKSASGGTGLGVAIAASLVRLHNGRLRFTSEVGRGTRAVVEFPAFAPASAPSEEAVQGAFA